MKTIDDTTTYRSASDDLFLDDAPGLPFTGRDRDGGTDTDRSAAVALDRALALVLVITIAVCLIVLETSLHMLSFG